MPRYFFVIDDGISTTDDSEGLELPNLGAARREAVRALTEIASEELPDDGDQRGLCVKVLDGAGRHLLSALVSFQIDDTHDSTVSGNSG
ncbi:MAG TPA: hypothetical protein VL418_10760 [Devosiaceae bacterium]|jgi:hypothetical protein|nr:hypothetical protein [Devosiaceae bacterium]